MTLSDILAAVSTYYGMSEIDIRSTARFRERVIVRQVYVYLARHLTTERFEDISRLVNRHWSTTCDGMDMMRHRLTVDHGLADDVEYLLGVLSGGRAEVRRRQIPAEWYAANARNYHDTPPH